MRSTVLTLEPLISAAKAVGGFRELAFALGLNRRAFYCWKQIPSGRVLQIEKITGGKVTAHQMRPDLYPTGLTIVSKRARKKVAA